MKAVPNSSGTSLPRFTAPADACDSHVHIYDTRFKMKWPNLRAVTDASIREYRMLQKRLGTSRVVVVQPAAYGTDNAVTLDAVAKLGPNARGIAVVHPTVTDTELVAMNRGGIRGLRFTLHEPRTAVTSVEMIEPLAHRAHRLGWHVQLHLRAEQVLDMAALIESLPGTVVFDHMARMPQPHGTHHPAFAFVKKMIDRGRAWVKLSGPYLDTQTGAPRYADLKPVAQAFTRFAPERCVWGSDWPHPTEPVSQARRRRAPRHRCRNGRSTARTRHGASWSRIPPSSTDSDPGPGAVLRRKCAVLDTRRGRRRVVRRRTNKDLENAMSIGLIVLIILVLLLLGAIPSWPHSRGWGYGPSGGIGLVLVIVIVLVLMGYI